MKAMPPQKLCKDCKYIQKLLFRKPLCMVYLKDLVYGKGFMPCIERRTNNNGYCGPEGEQWEKRDE